MKHPVRQEIVDEIKAKATTWTPREVHENHLHEIPVEQLKSKLGYLGVEESGNLINSFLGSFAQAGKYFSAKDSHKL